MTCERLLRHAARLSSLYRVPIITRCGFGKRDWLCQESEACSTGLGNLLNHNKWARGSTFAFSSQPQRLAFFFLFFFKVIIIVVCLFYYLMKWKSKPSTIIITQQLLSFCPFCWTLFIFSHSVNWVFIFWVWFKITVNAHVPFTRVHNHSSKMIYQKKKICFIS